MREKKWSSQGGRDRLSVDSDEKERLAKWA